jgi:hypothetical protein
MPSTTSFDQRDILALARDANNRLGGGRKRLFAPTKVGESVREVVE